MATNSARILRLADVIELTGLSKSTIYAYMEKGKFPKTRQLGERAVGWRELDINHWLEDLVVRDV